MLQIKKRDGSLVAFNPGKILNRIKKAAKGLKVNSDQIFINVVTSVPTEGIISTIELDALVSNTAAPYTGTHYDYSKFAADIAISSFHRITNENFAEVMFDLNSQGVINDVLVAKIKEYGSDNIQSVIDYERDYKFNYFAWKTLEQMYLLKNSNGVVVERPQQMYMRIALWVTDTFEDAKEMYDLLSNQFISCATPIMINSGTKNSQLASCVLKYNMGDSREGLLDTIVDSSTYSADAAGIGLCMSNIRSKDSRIASSGGKAGGYLKFVKIINESLRFFNQQGKRPGTAAIYLEPWHRDIFDHLDLKKNVPPEELRARDVFTAMWIPDNFMRAVEQNGDWYLFCPNDIQKAGLKPLQEVYAEEYEAEYQKAVDLGIGKKVKAQEIFMKMIESQIETGVPYMLYKDHVNRKSNHKNMGTVKQSNLCVAPETLVLTDEGYKEIQTLEDQNVTIWNGFEWSNVTPKKTNGSAKLYTVKLSDGSSLDCTDYHKWFINVNYKGKIVVKPTIELKSGDKIQKHNFPVITSGSDMKYAYTHGLFCAEGHMEFGNSFIWLYGDKKDLVSFLDIRNKYTGSKLNKETDILGINYTEKYDRLKVSLPFDIDEKFFVPLDCNINVKLNWLAGYLDGDGTIALNNQNGYFNQSIQACSVNLEFIKNVKLLLNTLGIRANIATCREDGDYFLPNGKGDKEIYHCNTVYRLTISSWYSKKLLELGIKFNRLKIDVNNPNRESGKYVEILEVIDNGRVDSTYCFTEEKNNSAIFNGVLTSQCAEIVEFTSEEITAICTLGSMVIKNYVNNKKFDFNLLHANVKKMVIALNKVIDINHYSTEKGRRGGLEQRALAIGVQGLADVFYLMDFIFTSDEAKVLNKYISETIYHAAIETSNELVMSGKYQPYKYFEGSPMSKGEFQYNMWGMTDDDTSGMWDWDTLRQNVMKYGICNSLFTAQMPVASSAKITDSYEMTEPADSNLFNRRVIGGEFLIANKYLINDLEKLGIWSEQVKNDIIINNGSIQSINFLKYLSTDDKNYDKKVKRIEYLLEKYKTVWEIKQKDLIDMAADRAPYIDQTQSMNIYMANPTVSKVSSSHFHAWRLGLKTGSYYMRTKAISTGAKHLAINVPETIAPLPEIDYYTPTKADDSPYECDGCSA